MADTATLESVAEGVNALSDAVARMQDGQLTKADVQQIAEGVLEEQKAAAAEINKGKGAGAATCCLTWAKALAITPRSCGTFFAKLIPKPTGGFRPICLFRSLYRIHMKSRGDFVRKWEAGVGEKVQGVTNETGRRIPHALHRLSLIPL